jgi:integrase
LDPKRMPRNFKSILKKAGLKDIKFHSLRHTYATRLFEVGVPIKTVQALMGHSDITTTMNIYTHVMPEQKAKAVEKIDNLFKI